MQENVATTALANEGKAMVVTGAPELAVGEVFKGWGCRVGELGTNGS